MSLSGSSGGSTSLGNQSLATYYNVDDILSCQERVPCKFDMQVYNLGYLDPGAESEHLVAGTKLELPFWLAKSMCTRRKQTVSIEIPKHFREGYREILRADATVMDLHKLGPYYFSFGTKLLQFQHIESPDIAKSLLQAFQTRFRTVMDMSQNAFNEDTSKLTERLDETEKLVFDHGQGGLNDFQRWETRQTEKLVTSSMVVNHRKRKRAAHDDI